MDVWKQDFLFILCFWEMNIVLMNRINNSFIFIRKSKISMSSIQQLNRLVQLGFMAYQPLYVIQYQILFIHSY